MVFAIGSVTHVGMLYAQTAGEGAIQGTVTDATGAVVPNAKVTAKNQASGVTTTRSTTGDGLYTISPLIPGKYDISVSAPGFSGLTQQNIQVDALHTVGVNLALTIGQADQSVTVSEAPPQLETTNATLGAVMENETYSNLPLQMSGQQRDPTAFATLVPGAQSGSRSPIIAGTGNYLAEVYLDGLPVSTINQQGDNRPISNGLNVDAVDQFQVVTSSPPAEYQGAGLINFTMKSGGNKYHGSAAMFFRNTIFDTWGYTAKSALATNPNAKKPYENQNEIAGTFGGPIPLTHNKGFFFASYDRYHGRNGANPVSNTIPTTQMQAGDFTQLLPAGTNLTNTSQTGLAGQIYDPTTTSCVGGTCTRQPFRGQLNGTPTLNVIPASYLSPIAQAMQKYLPQPTNSNRENNYLGGLPSGYDNWSFDTRVDYDLTSRQRISYVLGMGTRTNQPYVIGSSTVQLPLPYTWGTYASIKPFITDVEHSWAITDRLVNQFKFGFTRFAQPVTALTQGVAGYQASDLGITNLPGGQASQNFPGATFGTTQLFGTVQGQWTGAGASTASGATVPNTFTLVDNVALTKGKHSLTIGIQMQWLQDNVAAQSGPSGIVVLPFNANSTANFAGSTLSTASSGYSYASYMLGAVGGTPTYAIQATSETGGRYKAVSPYIQDDWKVTPKLTVNIGLRWDYFSPFHEVLNRWSYLDPTMTNPATGNLGALQFAGNRGAGISCNCATPVHAYFKNIGPRLGFAYSVNDKTVIRGGFAIAYSRAGGVGGRAGAGTGTGQLGLTGVTATAPAEVATGAGSGPSFYLNNSAGFAALGMGNTDWGGPGYTAPSVTAPNASSLILNTGNYLNSSGNFVTAGSAPGYADPYLSGRAPQVVFYNAGVQRSITNDLTIAVNYAGSQAHFINPSGANGRGYWSNSLNPVYLAGLGGVSSATSTTSSILDAPATSANIAKAQAAMPGIQVPYTGVAAAAAKSSRLTISQMLRAFPQYSSVSDLWGANIANISYNSLQLSLVQRSWKGLSYTLNYTYAHNIGDDGTFRGGFDLPSGVVSGTSASYSQNRIDRSSSTQAVPHSVSAFGVWQLPFGKDHIGANNALVRTLVGGWQMSGIFTYIGGSPVAVTSSGCRTEVGTCVPDLNADYHGTGRINGSYGSKNTGSDFTTQYLDPNAFAAPKNLFTAANPVYLIGNAARTHAFNMETPGKYNLDMGVKRSINLGSDRYKFIFEANCLNVTHKHTFTGLNSVWTPGSTTFGRFTGASGNRDWQLAGHINF
ncbi:MAG: carboxypeptidase regulatory-like domain-containing protein [Edaphobacter sp.]|uniref:carboxypeptidase regulatory-like domain-containing protein n=1 Tax=Edaphobacter sp. TaxID=1934404 RepID=UPI0023A2EFDC|nr:carboxypeptidase regulatory-like domain-containing protein [Edaphobacter sp.]MDE1177510.1 carboxypeptidase regulatory-like domain-containing protein [Edaphobacter sp.]